MGLGRHGHSHGGHGHSHNHSHSHNHGDSHGHGHGHGHSHGGGGGHDHGHSHGESSKFCGCFKFSNTARLSCMVVLTFSFFIVEVVVGQLTKSISMTTDSFHMLSDVLALLIGLFSVILSKRQSNKNTFGWVRAEILGALINSVFLISLCFSIFIEAVERFFKKEEIEQSHLLLYVGCAGLAINLLGLFIFGHGHSHELPQIESDEEELEELQAAVNDTHNSSIVSSNAGKTSDAERDADNRDNPENSSLIERKGLTNGQSNFISQNQPSKLKSKDEKKKSKKPRCLILTSEANMNMRAVFLHVMADALGSVVVIISALLNIYHEKLKISKEVAVYIDPCLSLILVALILASTIPLVKESALILLQTVPNNIRVEEIKNNLIQEIPGIISVHEMHIWKLSANKIIATAHITCESSKQYMDIAKRVKQFFHKRKIHSTTIQPEFRDHIDDILDERCRLECQKACNASKCCEDKSELKPSRSKGNLNQTTELNSKELNPTTTAAGAAVQAAAAGLNPTSSISLVAKEAPRATTTTTTINETESKVEEVESAPPHAASD